MSRFTKDHKNLYKRLPTFVVMSTEERVFVIGKCAATGFPKHDGARYEYAYMPETPDFRQMDTGYNRKQAMRYARHEHRYCNVRYVIDPDTRASVYALQVDRAEQAYDLPQFLPNISLTQEMIEAWQEMVRQEKEHLHQHIARLENRIDELTYAPKNPLGSSVKPQRRINVSEETS